MNWGDYRKYLKEGLEVNTIRQFHYLLIKIQTHWIASLGQTRSHFLVVTVLGLPMFLFGFWVVNYTQMGAFDTSTAPALSVIIWGMIYYPLSLIPIVYPIFIIMSLITGAFFKEFWVVVELIKQNIKQ